MVDGSYRWWVVGFRLFDTHVGVAAGWSSIKTGNSYCKKSTTHHARQRAATFFHDNDEK